MINRPIGPQDSAMGFRASAVGFRSVRPQDPTMSLRASASGNAKAVGLRYPRIADLLLGSSPQRAETMLEHPRSPRAPSSGYLHIPEQCWHLISLLAERPPPHRPETPSSRPGEDPVRAVARNLQTRSNQPFSFLGLEAWEHNLRFGNWSEMPS